MTQDEFIIFIYLMIEEKIGGKKIRKAGFLPSVERCRSLDYGCYWRIFRDAERHQNMGLF